MPPIPTSKAPEVALINEPLRYVGDLSREDSEMLAALAREARRILEYGVGASTQIFAQSAAPGTDVLSLDTEDYWIHRTRAILEEMVPGHGVRLHRFQRLTELDDLIDDGETGYQYPVGDSYSLAEAVRRLLPQTGSERIKRALKKKMAEYSLENAVDGIVMALEDRCKCR